jgi:hypothetical protein
VLSSVLSEWNTKPPVPGRQGSTRAEQVTPQEVLGALDGQKVADEITSHAWSKPSLPRKDGSGTHLPRTVSGAYVQPVPTTSTAKTPGNVNGGRSVSFSSGEPTLYGFAGVRADNLGSHADAVEVRDIARKHRLDVRSSQGRARAMALFYAQRGKTVRDAVDFDEAVAAHAREARMHFA